MKPKLKPCPFCGGMAIVLKHQASDINAQVRAMVVCGNCDCRTAYYCEVSDAIDVWNRRVKR